MKPKKIYSGVGGDEFGRFDSAMRGLLAVPYEELKEGLAGEPKKARKKRTKSKSSRRGVSRDSGEVSGTS